MVVGLVEQTPLWQRSRHPLRRRFESHFVRQLSHSRPVEQKAAEARERPGEKVKCIEDRLSPHLCNTWGGGEAFPAYQLLIMDQGDQHFPPFHLHAAVFSPVFILSNFPLPPPFLLYLHLCFTPSLSCCLSVMRSRTDAGSPNCGAEISAPVARQPVRVGTRRPPSPPKRNI